MNIRPTFYNFIRLVFRQQQVIFSRTRQIPIVQATKNYTFIKWYTTLSFLWITKNKNNALEKPAEKTPSKLDEADKLFENGHFEECHRTLVDYCKDEPEIEVQWRICRVLYNLSKETLADTNQKRQLIFEAYAIISNLIQKNSDHFAVQKWYALLLDAKSSYDGIKERIKQLENVRKHMDLAVTINPKDATTLHMLGEWCYQVTEMPWHQRKIAETFFASPPQSTYEDALEYFLRAEAVQPRFYSLNLLRIGNCYLKLKKPDQAMYYLKLAASYPAKSNEDHQVNKEAADLVKKIK